MDAVCPRRNEKMVVRLSQRSGAWSFRIIQGEFVAAKHRGERKKRTTFSSDLFFAEGFVRR